MPDNATITITIREATYRTLRKELASVQNRLDYEIPKADLEVQRYLRARREAAESAHNDLIRADISHAPDNNTEELRSIIRIAYDFFLGVEGAGRYGLSSAYQRTKTFHALKIQLLDAMRRYDVQAARAVVAQLEK